MRRLTFVLTIALAAFALHAQTAPAPAPTVSSRGSAEITAYLEAAVARGDIPGVVALCDDKAIEILRGFEQRVYRALDSE
jgi:hypothetical protein